MNLENINATLKQKTPLEIVQWAIEKSKTPIITTNFRPYEASLLHLVTKVKPDVKVIWCDTGYNTPDTYKHAEELIKKLNLNIIIYVPKQSSAHRDIILGIPDINDSKHKLFTEQVKIEPFRRAIKEHQPDVWFTNLRKGQTAFRDSIDIASKSVDKILKISPFYYWSDKNLDKYLLENKLLNEFHYFDPTKQLENRECGLHN